MARLCCSAQEIREIFVALRHDPFVQPSYSGTMEEPDLADLADLAELARRYLDLWERQVAAGASQSPAVAAVEAAKIMAAAISDQETAAQGGSGDGSATTSNASAAPGAASVHGDDRHDQFARRLAQCAEQLAALAAGTGQRGDGTDGGPEAE